MSVFGAWGEFQYVLLARRVVAELLWASVGRSIDGTDLPDVAASTVQRVCVNI